MVCDETVKKNDMLNVLIVNEVRKKNSKACLKRPFKIGKTKILVKNGSFMLVKSIAECLKAFCNTFDLH